MSKIYVMHTILIGIYSLSGMYLDSVNSIRYFGLPFSQILFFSHFIFSFALIIKYRYVNIFNSIVFISLLIIIMISFLSNPARDTYFESFALLSFILTFEILVRLFATHEFSIWSIKRFTQAITIYIIGFACLGVLGLLPVPDSGELELRKEALITSTSVFLLFPVMIIALAEKNRILKIYLPFCVLAIILILLVTVTRSTMILSAVFLSYFITIAIFYKSISTQQIGLFSLILCASIYYLYVAFFDEIDVYLKYVAYRFQDNTGDSLNYRNKEILQELSILNAHPFFGAGLGIRYADEYLIGEARAFYGHNMYTSLFARVGWVFGCIFILYQAYLLRFLKNINSIRELSLWLMYLCCVFIFCNFSNFIYQLYIINFAFIFSFLNRKVRTYA